MYRSYDVLIWPIALANFTFKWYRVSA